MGNAHARQDGRQFGSRRQLACAVRGSARKPDEALLKTLFHPDSYWRDVLALSWNIQTLNGDDAILKACRRWPAACAQRLRHRPDRAAPRKVMRAGTNAIEAIFKFETKVGRGSGIIRLIPDADDGNRSRPGRC
jgi:putative flavoprotein involved in K+ transport